MSASSELSIGLQALVNDLSPFEGEVDGVSIEQAEVRRLLLILRTMQALATNLEIEVRCLRDMEAEAEAHRVLEDEATDQLADLLGDGNVIRPQFGRKP